MVVAIVGSRKWPFPEVITNLLHELCRTHPGFRVVTGGARGADRIAEQWCREWGIPVKVYHADWELWGDDAGFVRNQYIVDDADVLYAFQLNRSSGTQDSVNKARIKGIPCHVTEALLHD
jgi:hypothetical protein